MSVILVVEDDPPQRTEIQGALVQAGHRVDVAAGGTAALEWLKTKHYDLLLTDLMMEQGTGFEVLEWVRENMPGLPVVICSSYAKAENLRTFLTTHFYRIVRKPVQMDDLVRQVRELLAAAK
jgi:CheY-like chemotaxis protein